MKLADTASGYVAREGTYINFVRAADEYYLKGRHKGEKMHITPRFGVVTKEASENGVADTLGVIKWHGAWRCYAFFPEPDTLYERKCLSEITQFLIDLMEERKR